DSRRSWFTILI
ncbi:unnamed protein product, partial [Rotaria sp. Silwood1]